ncbi:TonB-dependent receptor [Paucibacter sp. TC2R-5]|uniref:TonB-dependent receptor domain-containing protein n=1 Tax=Paucibacter sp. TC2R-5 TaxID=2893555 RepID=UPI0021E4E1FC|nr:TonB-dependent receptor [Paucibacter sp. TC2R-5]MCV2361289.1 TonB-dependent receptor [Paucibacter sp. TC2R-5]
MQYPNHRQLAKLAPLAPLAFALACAYAPHFAHAQSTAPATTVDPQSLPQVQVTGSRISRALSEGPSSMTVLKSEDISRLGFKSVGDALNALTENTGFTQGEDFGNTFTPAANAISLRGLGPNHTLTLINGRRIADYPSAYDGAVNFTNTANIPSALIDRIEILNGGASAIYGSDAIAGVVNIILKKQAQGVTLNLKAGGTQLGGGANARAQISGGFEAGALSGVYGLEFSKRDPIWSLQRDFMADTTLKGANPGVVIGRKDAKTNKYIAPEAGACEAAGQLFNGSTKTATIKSGQYCGSGQTSPTFWTTQTGNQSSNFAGVLNYALTPQTELFAELLLGFTETENNTRGPAWTSLGATSTYFQNANSGKLETWSRRFAPEELGGADKFNRRWNDEWHNLVLGARGDIAGSWVFEAALNTSAYTSKLHRPRLLANVDEFFLGAKKGETAKGEAIYAPDVKRLFKPLTPAEYDSIASASYANDKAWTHNLNVNASGELLKLPAGALRAAVLAEAGAQGFENNADPRLGQGVFYNTLEVANVSGDRNRWALGAELNAPITKTLIGTLATRYDQYRFAGRKDGSFTYNAGLEFRPVSEVLLRANHATSFRAPDMSYIFTAESRGYYPSSTDYYRCAQAGQPLDKCEFVDIVSGFNYLKNGSKDLKSEKGKSWGLGLVWSPSKAFEGSFDLWKIAINDLVIDLDSDKILRDEAECRTGVQNISSPSCADAIKRVRRNPADAVVKPGEVNLILVNPINAASQSTYGFDISARYALKTSNLGEYTLTGKYTQVQSFVYQQFAGDADTNRVGTPEHSDWPNKLIATLGWNLGDFGATLTGQRNGKISSSDKKSWLGPYWNFNASARYQVSKASSVSLIVNNLLGDIRKDPSAAWPYYPVGYYLPHGRQGWIEFNHVFGS